MDLVNRMRTYKDPLLAAFDEELDKEEAKKGLKAASSKSTKADADSDDESSSGSDGTSSEDEEEAVDIKFPRNNATDLHQFISRDLTNLGNKEDGQKRKFALIRLYQIFVLAKDKAPNKLYQELLPEI
jgi:hypothetical protein